MMLHGDAIHSYCILRGIPLRLLWRTGGAEVEPLCIPPAGNRDSAETKQKPNKKPKVRDCFFFLYFPKKCKVANANDQDAKIKKKTLLERW